MTTRGATRRRQLLTVAGELFARDGYHNVSVGELAAAAGVSGPAIYRHFPGKQAIMAELMRAGFDEIEAIGVTTVGVTTIGVETPAKAGEQVSAAERIDALVHAFAAYVVRHPEFGVLWRREFRHLAPDDAAEMAERMRSGPAVPVAELRRMRPELAAADANLLAWSALSVLGSVSDHRIRPALPDLEGLLAGIAADVLRVELPTSSAESSAIPPISPIPSAQEPANRREQLVTEAARLFWASGYHGVTMEDVGTAAGIAGPSVYKHFAGKADLLRAVVRRLGDRLEATLDGLAPIPADPELATAWVEELVRRYVETVVANRGLVVTFHAEAHNLPDRDRVEVRRLVSCYVQRWAAGLAAALPDRTDAEIRIRIYAAFAVVNDSVRTRRLAEQPDVAGRLRALTLAILRPERPAPASTAVPVPRPGHRAAPAPAPASTTAPRPPHPAPPQPPPPPCD
ncbi:AcrR family transcriptional regulator [Catenulispora sp. EB89]|uniref:TetR/AcrR family transcriptional regulator n=1 Tax=Catenulispora sp. EB89 TaxID=3156257 RepID=UPI0035182465